MNAQVAVDVSILSQYVAFVLSNAICVTVNFFKGIDILNRLRINGVYLNISCLFCCGINIPKVIDTH